MTKLEAAAKAYRECLAEYLEIEAAGQRMVDQIKHLRREQDALGVREHAVGAKLIKLREALCEEAGK